MSNSKSVIEKYFPETPKSKVSIKIKLWEGITGAYTSIGDGVFDYIDSEHADFTGAYHHDSLNGTVRISVKIKDASNCYFNYQIGKISGHGDGTYEDTGSQLNLNTGDPKIGTIVITTAYNGTYFENDLIPMGKTIYIGP